jgi:hypothetical protein
MPRSRITKEEITCRVMKLKNELYDGTLKTEVGSWHDGAHSMLNRVLNILEEYHL